MARGAGEEQRVMVRTRVKVRVVAVVVDGEVMVDEAKGG
ncbi:protein of unknown function [Candidatus Nitrosocaldus cavascurensis]|uniref:Uncharacterized protein n=1 Tax=Candidatus Nitrosocaldus cavascurensis TaxID=2058097 RepID=A0A2K5AQS8_9ARCH|nr:protein of unknown function [Candidatus Nitrosocaldus cavascurensis]